MQAIQRRVGARPGDWGRLRDQVLRAKDGCVVSPPARRSRLRGSGPSDRRRMSAEGPNRDCPAPVCAPPNRRAGTAQYLSTLVL